MNLSVFLETLFSPEGDQELTHQIAYNFAWFGGNSDENRKEIYKLIKKFYNLRSKIVHGDIPNQDKLVELTPEIFLLCAECLKKILSSEELIQIFNDSFKRKSYFEKFMFDSEIRDFIN